MVVGMSSKAVLTQADLTHPAPEHFVDDASPWQQRAPVPQENLLDASLVCGCSGSHF